MLTPAHDLGYHPPMKPMLAHPWDGTSDLTGWWLSEKLDGVRAIWLPYERRFVSRNGKEFVAPEWFRDAMPREVLDGELFLGRGEFQSLISAVRKKTPVDEEWERVIFAVFDAPTVDGPCEERWEFAEELIATHDLAPLVTVPQTRCESAEHLVEMMSEMDRLGAEGLMARKPGSVYTPGRTRDLLKIKKFHDAEARVIGHEPGKGKHEGRLGALICETPEGIRFGVGTGLSDTQRENPPPVGSVITYRFFERTKAGVPRFPSFVATRDYE